MLYPSCFTDSPAITLHRGFPPLIEMFPKIEKKGQNCIRGVLGCNDSNLIFIKEYLSHNTITNHSNLSGLIPGMPEGKKIVGCH